MRSSKGSWKDLCLWLNTFSRNTQQLIFGFSAKDPHIINLKLIGHCHIPLDFHSYNEQNSDWGANRRFLVQESQRNLVVQI